jgi:antitoxin component of MazEF toxin-antitoxin module
MQIKLESDGSLRLPQSVLDAIGAEPGDELKLFVDNRRKSVRIERYATDPWADAMREQKTKKLDDVLADQEKRHADAEDLFDKKLRDAEPGDGKPSDDADKWR